MKIICFDLLGTLLDNTSENYVLYPDSIPVLKKLFSKYILILVTSGKNITNITELLKEKKLIEYFNKVYHTKNTNLKKENGSVFKKIISDYNISQNDLIVIGDIPQLDMRGARKVCSKSIRIKRGKYKQLKPDNELEKPSYETDNLFDVTNFCAKIFGEKNVF